MRCIGEADIFNVFWLLYRTVAKLATIYLNLEPYNV